MHAWRGLLLRLFGAKLGKGVHVHSKARIWAPWNLVVGNRVGIADGVNIYNMAPVQLGDYSTLSTGSYLCGGSHDVDSANFQLITGPIEISSYAWICAEAFIAQNVHVPEGAVVAARAVVTRSLPTPWTVYAGIPARPIRNRSKIIKEQSRHEVAE